VDAYAPVTSIANGIAYRVPVASNQEYVPVKTGEKFAVPEVRGLIFQLRRNQFKCCPVTVRQRSVNRPSRKRQRKWEPLLICRGSQGFDKSGGSPVHAVAQSAFSPNPLTEDRAFVVGSGTARKLAGLHGSYCIFFLFLTGFE